MGIDVASWRQKIGCFTQPKKRVVPQVAAIAIGNTTTRVLMWSVLLYIALVGACQPCTPVCSYVYMDMVSMSPSTHAHNGTFGMLTRAGTQPLSNVPSPFGDNEQYGVAGMTIMSSLW